MTEMSDYGSFDEGPCKSKGKRALKVFIYESELNKIHKWVLLKTNIETGGDLFGLWVDKRTVVIQFVLGPGANCRRGVTSFYQDVPYLGKSGDYLTKVHGLCNVGQWHSHHRLKLSHPSSGDENTVWSNMPKLGLSRYIVFIATINGWQKHKFRATEKCFLFELADDKRLPVLKGKFKILPDTSPLSMNPAIEELIKEGAEEDTEPDESITETTKDPETLMHPSKDSNCCGSRSQQQIAKAALAITVALLVIGIIILLVMLKI